jgi:hypothetical protein
MMRGGCTQNDRGILIDAPRRMTKWRSQTTHDGESQWPHARGPLQRGARQHALLSTAHKPPAAPRRAHLHCNILALPPALVHSSERPRPQQHACSREQARPVMGSRSGATQAGDGGNREPSNHGDVHATILYVIPPRQPRRRGTVLGGCGVWQRGKLRPVETAPCVLPQCRSTNALMCAMVHCTLHS